MLTSINLPTNQPTNELNPPEERSKASTSKPLATPKRQRKPPTATATRGGRGRGRGRGEKTTRGRS